MKSNITTKKQNELLNFIKGIACVFVVFMHAEFPGYLGTFVQCISRFAVPIFFMVSGYFCRPKSKDYKEVFFYLLKKFKHIFNIIIISSALYIVYELIKCAVLEDGYISLLSQMSIRNIVILLIFNEPFIINGSLWFLFALLYCYVFYFVLFKIDRIYFKLLPILFIILIMLGQGLYVLGISIPNYIYRNFFFEGMPFFMLGNYLAVKSESKLLRFSNKTLGLLIALSTLVCLAERLIISRDFGVHIGSIFQALFLLCFAVNNPTLKVPSFICVLGKKYSLFVYVVHRMVLEVVEFVALKMMISENIFYRYSYPIIVLIITIIVGFMFYKAIDILKKETVKG